MSRDAAQDCVTGAIREFGFSDYSMDFVDEVKDEEWLGHLAYAVTGALRRRGLLKEP